VAASLTALGMKLRVDVVGFALAEEAVKQKMEHVAALTGARFFDAQDAAAVQASALHSLAAPYDVIDGAGTLMGGGQIVPLLGVRGVPGEHANLLGQYIGNRAVACAPEVRGQYRYIIGEFDLLVVVLFNGGGRAMADAPAYLTEAEAHAQANRLGVWC